MVDSVAVPTMGTTISINGTPIGQIMDISGPALSTDTNEITNHDSPDNTEEFIATIKRTGEIGFPLVFDPNATGHVALQAAWEARSKDAYVMTYPDETGLAGAGASWAFSAYCTGFSMTAPVTGHLAADIKLRVTGSPVFTPAGS